MNLLHLVWYQEHMSNSEILDLQKPAKDHISDQMPCLLGYSCMQPCSVKLSKLNWVHVCDFGSLDDMGLSWLCWNSLSNDFLASGLSLNLQFVVGLDSLDESES